MKYNVVSTCRAYSGLIFLYLGFIRYYYSPPVWDRWKIETFHRCAETQFICLFNYVRRLTYAQTSSLTLFGSYNGRFSLSSGPQIFYP